uniref:C25 family cysteine peptidase n=1 Tax=Paraconexibacter sp. TaxID=2949640 RepID=UPI003566A685
SVSLNGTPLGTATFEGQDATTQTFDAGGAARSGANSVTLQAESSGDVSLVERVTLRYRRAYVADGETLAAPAPAGRRMTISGFTSNGARVVDVTDPTSPLELVTDPSQTGATVTATVPGDSGTRQVLAFGPGQVRPPASIATGAPSTLRDPANDGALTIITTPGYEAALAPLVARRRAQGLTVRVARLQDVYDEFSFGTADHRAILRFLDHARGAWRTPPQYVLLGGDGSFDPRGFLGRGTEGNVIPVALIDTDDGESASDSRLTGTLRTGRLPARTSAQMDALVAKTLRYEDRGAAGAATLVSDVPDTYPFGTATDGLTPLLPAGWALTRVDRATQPDAKSRLIAALRAGPSSVNYSGHGSVDLWRGDLLTNADAGGLSNTSQPSLYVLMTCLNGYFTDPVLPALAEALLGAPGGAAAVLSSTTAIDPEPQTQANRGLLAALYGGSGPVRLGDAVQAALAPVSDPDVRQSETLFGDPTLLVPR